MLGSSAVAVVVRMRPRAIPLAMITMRKKNSWVSFSFLCEYGARPAIGGFSGSRSSALSTSGNSRDININTSRNIRKTSPLICLLQFSLVKLGSHLCEKQNIIEISIEHKHQKKGTCFFFSRAYAYACFTCVMPIAHV